MSSNWWKGLHENTRRVTLGIYAAIGLALVAIGVIVARGQH